MKRRAFFGTALGALAGVVGVRVANASSVGVADVAPAYPKIITTLSYGAIVAVSERRFEFWSQTMGDRDDALTDEMGEKLRALGWKDARPSDVVGDAPST